MDTHTFSFGFHVAQIDFSLLLQVCCTCLAPFYICTCLAPFALLACRYTRSNAPSIQHRASRQHCHLANQSGSLWACSPLNASLAVGRLASAATQRSTVNASMRRLIVRLCTLFSLLCQITTFFENKISTLLYPFNMCHTDITSHTIETYIKNLNDSRFHFHERLAHVCLSKPNSLRFHCLEILFRLLILL